jgi:hypothetical protein
VSLSSSYFGPWGPFNGPFTGFNTKVSQNQEFSRSSVGNFLTFTRPNEEIITDLGHEIATDETTGRVSNALTNVPNMSLTSHIRVQGVAWQDVPYFWQNIVAHKIDDMLVRVDFDFHIETPWFCSDADGNISVYLFLFLDSGGRLRGVVDGTWFSYDGGGPFCTGPITAGLNSAMPGVRKQVEPILAAAIAKVPSAIRFRQLYYLPGTGTQASGGFAENGATDLALALLPG